MTADMDVLYIQHFNKSVPNSSSPRGYQRKWIQGKLKHHILLLHLLLRHLANAVIQGDYNKKADNGTVSSSRTLQQVHG